MREPPRNKGGTHTLPPFVFPLDIIAYFLHELNSALISAHDEYSGPGHDAGVKNSKEREESTAVPGPDNSFLLRAIIPLSQQRESPSLPSLPSPSFMRRTNLME